MGCLSYPPLTVSRKNNRIVNMNMFYCCSSRTAKAKSSPPQHATPIISIPSNPALELAIKQHLRQITGSDRAAFLKDAANLTADNLLEEIIALDDGHRDTSTIRSNVGAITTFLEFLERFVRSISIAIQANPEVSAIVVGGALIVLQSALRFTEYFIKLTDMLTRLNDHLKPLSEYAKIPTPTVIECTAAAYLDILTFCHEARHIFVDRSSGASKKKPTAILFIRSQWQPFESQFSAIETRFKHHLGVLSQSTNAIGYLHVQHMVEKLAQHDLDVAARIKEERREAFLTWLAGAEFEGKHLEINAKTYPGTCSWIQQRLEFDIWLQNSGRPVLWCEGKPGIGKSVLASNVIEFIKAKFAMAQPTAVTYVYYDQQEAKLTSISELIRSLIQQLCYQIDEIPESLLQLKRSCQSPLAIATPSNLARLVQSFHRTFLVVDALDECQSDHRHQVIQLILGCENIPFNVFVTSRRDSDILDSFTCPNVTVLNMTAFDVADDIHHFVTGQVKSLRKRGHGRRLYLQDDALEQTIITELTEGSDGMFLWVDLQLINLCRISKSKQDELVRDTLTSLPQGLEKTYDQILKQIEDNGGYMRTLAERSFMWVLYADRPLRKVELQQAVKTNPGPFLQADQLDLDISSLEVIFDACGSLLIEAGDFIRPIHFSVKEYFLSDGVTGPNMFSLLRDPTLVSEVLALSCLNHLMELLQPQSSWKNIYDLQDFIRAHPLVVHASQVFDHHVAGATHMSTTLRASLQSFFDQRQEFHAAILQLRTIVYPVTLNDLLFSTQSVLSDANAGTVLYSTRLYDTLGQHPLCQDLQPPKYMLHQAAAGGHALLCIRCIENGEDVNQPDGNGTSPIYHACLGGHEQVVSTLIDYQANIDIKGGHYGCPLQAAAYRGHMRVIEILIHRGADLIGHGGAFSSALAAAAAGGHEQAAYVLLMAGADVNYQGNKNSDRPLHLACAGGHKAVVKLILKQANVEIHAVGRAGGTALAKAAANGHKHLFPLLIDAAGVDIDLVSKHYGTALQAAAAEGHYDVFRDLIDRGADALVQGGRFGTCIQAASAGGNAEIVKMLLDQKNVPVNVVDGHYGTALQAASALGHLKIMKMLLDASAKVNIQGGHHGTSLQAAACWNHKEAVVMLLEHGAKVNASAGYHGTALQAACAGTHRDVVQLLLSRGADPRLEAGYYGTPLQAAAAKGDVETVQSLLGRGADAKQGGGKYRDAVHAATAKGHLDVVEILLESQVLN